MAIGLKGVTISVTPNMDAELDSAKTNCYYKKTRNDMFRDLINRGLASLENESVKKPERPM